MLRHHLKFIVFSGFDFMFLSNVLLVLINEVISLKKIIHNKIIRAFLSKMKLKDDEMLDSIVWGFKKYLNLIKKNKYLNQITVRNK